MVCFFNVFLVPLLTLIEYIVLFEVPVFLTYFNSFFTLSTSLMFSVGQISVGFSVGPHSDFGIVCTSCNLTVATNYL